jgi:hypothetical protein
MSTTLLIIKLCALGLTAVLGVLGISRSAKSPDGKMTRWGRTLIATAFLSFLLTAGTQFLELQMSIAHAEQAVSRLAEGSARQQEMLDGISRSLFPLYGAKFELFINVPADEATQAEFRKNPDEMYVFGEGVLKHTDSALNARLNDCALTIKLEKMRIGRQPEKYILFNLERGSLLRETRANWYANKPNELLVMATTPVVAPTLNFRVATLDDLIKTNVNVETCDEITSLSSILVQDPTGRPLQATLQPAGRGKLSGYVFTGQLQAPAAE